jgi:hypothetical protein
MCCREPADLRLNVSHMLHLALCDSQRYTLGERYVKRRAYSGAGQARLSTGVAQS